MDFSLLVKILLKIKKLKQQTQKLLDHAKQFATDAFKIVSKRTIQKTEEATSDFIGKKIADKITRTSAQNTSEKASSKTVDIGFDAKIPKDTCPQKRQQIIDEIRLM